VKTLSAPAPLRDAVPNPAGPHPLHAEAQHWPETNCYVDLWIELLHAWGYEPLAALAFTVRMDFEGDAFTFFKFPAEDLELLFGVVVQEAALHDAMERHVSYQVGRGRVVLLECDGFHLPDTAGTTYRRAHAKTTIAIDSVEPARQRASYFHNSRRALLTGEDYLAVLSGMPERLPPYLELVKRIGPPLTGQALRIASRDLLAKHLRRCPAVNPFTAYRAAFAGHLAEVASQGSEHFHRYAFNTMRQFGAAFELLARYAEWLDPEGLEEAVRECDRIAGSAKILQFRAARLVARRSADPCADVFDALEAAHERSLSILRRWL